MATRGDEPNAGSYGGESHGRGFEIEFSGDFRRVEDGGDPFRFLGRGGRRHVEDGSERFDLLRRGIEGVDIRRRNGFFNVYQE